MHLIKKIYKIANIKADELLTQKNKHKMNNYNCSLMNDKEFMKKFKESNNRIQNLRDSIQNTKL